MPLPLDFDLRAFGRLRIVHIAEAALATEPRSITTVTNPRSAGGPHDFSSEGDYWWPDPANPGGPYISRDGLTNPDNFVAHRQLLLGFSRDFGALAAAYRVSGEERFAVAAVRLAHVWFVEPATRMNPSLPYSQAVRNRNTGRSYGVIDTLHLAEVALGLEALRGAKALTPTEDAALTGWFRDYLTWLHTHPFGVDESKAENNHGACWALQAAAFAHLTGNETVLADCRRRFKEILLPKQMAPDGRFPRELARTKPYGYSLFNLDVMTALAVVLSTTDEDLMHFTLPDGRNLVKGVEYLAPFIADKSQWPGKHDVMHWDDWPVRQPALLFGALAAGRRDWLELWQRLEPDPSDEEVRRNFPIRNPVLWVPPQRGAEK